jgi:hypothetical protein
MLHQSSLAKNNRIAMVVAPCTEVCKVTGLTLWNHIVIRLSPGERSYLTGFFDEPGAKST